MSSLLFCDNGHHPFSQREVGSQNIMATTVHRDDQGNLTSSQERYDLCAAHALGAPAEVPTYQATVEAATPVKEIGGHPLTGVVPPVADKSVKIEAAAYLADYIVDREKDRWTWDASVGKYVLHGRAEGSTLTLKEIGDQYGIRSWYNVGDSVSEDDRGNY